MDILVVVVVVFIVIAVVAIIVSSSGGGAGQAEWKKVAKSNIYKAESKLSSSNYYEVKDSLVELDKLLDYVLKSKRVKGETLGERLKNASSMFSKNDYNALWSAHKLRNQMVHEVEHNININMIKNNSRAVASILKKTI